MAEQGATTFVSRHRAITQPEYDYQHPCILLISFRNKEITYLYSINLFYFIRIYVTSICVRLFIIYFQAQTHTCWFSFNITTSWRFLHYNVGITREIILAKSPLPVQLRLSCKNQRTLADNKLAWCAPYNRRQCTGLLSQALNWFWLEARACSKP